MPDSLKTKKRPQIVSPAGNLEKLRFAVAYGADSVYFGADAFNLRVRSDNFSREDLERASSICRENDVSSVFLLNAFLHESDLEEMRGYLDSLKDLSFDAVMISDPGMLDLLEKAGWSCDIHLSTQVNTLNHMAARFWKRSGVKRLVLAREVKPDEIERIKGSTDIEIEVFVHGALCVAYSGRCLLSRYLSGRDANQGDCSQPCRWNYRLMEEKRPGQLLTIGEEPRGTAILASKDLCLIEHVERLATAGVDALKIEGRMKSLYHAANATRIYKDAAVHAETDEFPRRLPFWRKELEAISHRPYTDDLFDEFSQRGYEPITYIHETLYLGHVVEEGTTALQAEVHVANPIFRGESVEVVYPIDGSPKDGCLTIEAILGADGEPTDMALPRTTALLRFNAPVHRYGIFRRRLENSV